MDEEDAAVRVRTEAPQWLIRNPQARQSVIVPLAPGDGMEAGALKGVFDIVLDL